MMLIKLASEVGLHPRFVAGTQGGEYHSSCPACGGTDRFFIQPNKRMRNCVGYYCCRQCGTSGDAIQFCRDFLGCDFTAAVERAGAVINNTRSRSIQRYQIAEFARIVRPPEAWINKASQFVEACHQEIFKHPQIIRTLEQRGLPLEAILRYKLGYNSTDLYYSRSDWDLEGTKLLWLPGGIVIPMIEINGDVVRLKIRRDRWAEDDGLPKYIAVSGSMNGLSLIGRSDANTILVVESELDAYALNYALDGLALVIAVGSNIKRPDIVTNFLVQRCSKLLIMHDNDAAGDKMWEIWRGLYPHAYRCPTPVGKDIGEAIEVGLDVADWTIGTLHAMS